MPDCPDMAVSTSELTLCVVAMAGDSGRTDAARLGGALASMAEPESDMLCGFGGSGGYS